ncbi:hypothetical protein ACFWB0_16100 [Rhodococcus sp. NPDC060086]|uniref:hypothetical protein n=1 Tax=Rhodococcus sp. NPDC060086 TaxID=3347055 RepID=UPI00365AB277
MIRAHSAPGPPGKKPGTIEILDGGTATVLCHITQIKCRTVMICHHGEWRAAPRLSGLRTTNAPDRRGADGRA